MTSGDESKHTILIVDDEPYIISALKMILVREGFTVVSAENGEEALEVLKDHEVSMIITDHRMPVMEGAVLLARVRASTPDIIRILMTGFTDMETAAKAVNDAEIYRFIIKPWSIDQLLSIVMSGIAQFEMTRENRRLTEIIHKQNKQLKEKNVSLIELDRVKKKMTNMIVHDLKGPLAGVMANIDLISLGTINAEDQESLDLATEGCNELLRLIMNILSVSKMEEGKLKLSYQEVTLDDTIDACIDQLLGVGRLKELTFMPVVFDGIGKVLVDHDMISRTIVNLLTNAINYSPEGEKIIVKANNAENEEMVQVSVQDFGPGIPPKETQKIFELFSQVESENRHVSLSTGIGLAFCKMAVEAHGGKIWVESKEDHGSNFNFLIPKRPGAKIAA